MAAAFSGIAHCLFLPVIAPANTRVVDCIVRLFALAFLAGTFALQQAAELPETRIAGLGAALLLALVLVGREARLARAVLVLAAGFAFGYGAAAWRAENRLADALPLEWEGRDIEVVGVVAGLPQPGEKGVRFAFDVERTRTQRATVPETISLTWYAERVKGADAIPPPAIQAGERWRVTVRLKRPRGLANPHGFDFEPWALERGIRATGYVRTREGFESVDARVAGFMYAVHRWRGEIRDAMKERLGEARLRGVLVALAIGDQDAIAADDWEVFWRTGVGHLMSISGLHITMIAGLAFVAVFFFWVRIASLALRWPARKAAVVAGALSPLANAFAIPIVSLVVVPLTLAGAFLPLPFLLDAAHLLMVWLMVPLEWLADLPLAMLESHAPLAWTVAAAIGGVLWLLAPRGVPMRSAGAVWMAPMFVVLPASPLPGEAWLDVLDVGQGLAVVVRTERHAFAYDAGPTWSADSDSGQRIVVPFLRGEGIGRLDGLVVSHADDDHSGGAASVALSRRPEWLLSPLASDDPLHHAVDRSLRCEAGMLWRWDGVEFKGLHPGAEIYEEAIGPRPTPGRRHPGEVRGPIKRKENDRGCAVCSTGNLRPRSGSKGMLDGSDIGAKGAYPHDGSSEGRSCFSWMGVAAGEKLLQFGRTCSRLADTGSMCASAPK